MDRCLRFVVRCCVLLFDVYCSCLLFVFVVVFVCRCGMYGVVVVVVN